MVQPTYAYTKVIKGTDFDRAVERVAEALKVEGFGVLTEIDVKATLKKKLDVDFRNYKILGACNPPLAHKAFSSEIGIGLLLPCKVVVYEDDGRKVTVSLVKPQEMFKVVQNQELPSIAVEVDQKLLRVLEAL